MNKTIRCYGSIYSLPKVDIRDQVRDGLHVWLWVTRSYKGNFKNRNHGWVLIKAIVEWDREEMRWRIIPDKADIEVESEPRGQEQVKQDVDYVYYNEMCNPFNRVKGLINKHVFALYHS